MNKSKLSPEFTKEWEGAIKNIKQNDRIIVIGATDSGKTSFIIASSYVLGKIAVIDMDPGQQTFSVPTVISSGFINNGEIELYKSFFVGASTPTLCLFECICGLTLLLRSLIQNLRTSPLPIFLDTTGFIYGDQAVHYKLAKISVFSPSKIIFIEEGDEISQLKNFITRKHCEFYTIPSYIGRKKHDQNERAEIRNEKFKIYFSNVETMKILPEKILFSESIEEGDIVSFFKGNFTEFLGFVSGFSMDEEKKRYINVKIPERYFLRSWDFAVKGKYNIKGVVETR